MVNSLSVRAYKNEDLSAMTEIWNEVVKYGVAFPQTEPLTENEAADFFKSQDYCGVAELNGNILGLYILHPNNVGRCGHIANASYAVKGQSRGLHIGEALVKHSLSAAYEKGFRIMQFNAVVSSNIHARHLYERLGFQKLGIIPNGFRLNGGKYEDIVLYYIELEKYKGL